MRRVSGSAGLFLPLCLVLGFVFLYGPIVSLIVYSFNASELVTVWSGFSFKWYGALAQNEAILRAAWISLRIAAMAASGALILGTLAGFALARFGGFFGRNLLGGMLLAPLVMPEIITGMSMLLMFIGTRELIGWPQGQGILTITLAHVTFCLSFVAVIVRSRLSTFDRSIEEAARDLGARPVTVFFLITLPMMAPALAAAWLLAFSLSLDDLVITNFVSGPGSTTLPMYIFSKVRLGLSPEINALAAIIVFTVSLAVFLAAILQSRRSRRQLSAGSQSPAHRGA